MLTSHTPDRSTIRDANAADFGDILWLNTEWVHFTSHLDEAALAKLHAMSPYHRVAVSGGRVVAFLLALRGLGVSKDVIVTTSDRFERMKGLACSLEHEVATEGRLLYERRELARFTD